MNTTMQACTAGPGQRSEPMAAEPAGDLMTRRQVASVFRVTSAAVAAWARRGRLAEVRDESGKPRYRRGDVEALARSRPGRRAR